MQQLVPLRADQFQLDAALPLECRHRKRRIQQHIGKNIEAGVEIATQNLRGDTETVVAPKTLDAAADRLDGDGDLFRAPAPRALKQHFRDELRQPVISGGFDQHAALQDRPHLDKRQAMVFLDQ